MIERRSRTGVAPPGLYLQLGVYPGLTPGALMSFAAARLVLAAMRVVWGDAGGWRDAWRC